MTNDDIFFENDVIIDVELENVYIIDQGAVTKVVARKYSSESTYNIGDYIIYRNELYKCIADISTPEEFDPTKWTKLFVVDELKNIYSIIPTKADKSTTYTKTETDNLLNEKADKIETYTKTETDNLLNKKADKSATYTKTETDNLLNTKADKSTTYTKTDTDTLLNAKADKSMTYTKTEVDTALANKANSADVYTKTETYSKIEVDTDIYKKTETYSKTEVDTALSEKADTSAVTTALSLKADKADTYTKEEVDDKFDEIDPIGTASGAIASFETNLTALLNSLKCDITASGGNGSPDSPIPIIGHSELNLTRCGVNLFDEDRLLNATGWSKSGDYYVGNVGQLYTLFNVNGDFWHSENGVDSLRVNYTAYVDQANVNARAEFYYSDGTSSLAGVINGSTPTEYTAVSTSGKTVIAIKWNFSNDAILHIKDFSINYPSTDTNYHAYNGQTFTVAFGQTVYGGVLDVTRGKLTVTHVIETYDGSEGWSTIGTNVYYIAVPDEYQVSQIPLCNSYTGVEPTFYNTLANGCCALSTVLNNLLIHDDNITSLSDWKTALGNNNLEILYELATPIVIDVPSISVSAENGTNNVFSDTGDTEVKYFKGMAEEIEEVFKNSNFVDLSDIPDLPNIDGSYRLNLTITDGKPAYSWEEIT